MLTAQLQHILAVFETVDLSFLSAGETLKSHVFTGKSTDLEEYWKLTDVMTEHIDWTFFTNFKHLGAETRSFQEILRTSGFLMSDIAYAETALRKFVSDVLWYHVQAINWSDGKFDKDNRAQRIFSQSSGKKSFVNFTDVKEPDREKALELLNNMSYLDAVDDIRRNLRRTQTLVCDRLINKINTIVACLIIAALCYLIPLRKNITGLFGVVLLIMYVLNKARDARRTQIGIAVALNTFATSEDITNLIRTYVATEHVYYLDMMWKIERIRSGIDKIGDQYYIPFHNDSRVSFDELYDVSSLDETDISKLSDIIDDSQELMWMEIVAINMAQGFFDENNEAKDAFDKMDVKTFIKFSKTGEKDSEGAVKLLFSDEYQTVKKDMRDRWQNVIRNIDISKSCVDSMFTVFLIIGMILISSLLKGLQTTSKNKK
jgi:hypothetical protein